MMCSCLPVPAPCLNSAPAQQQAQPAGPFTRTTKFNDLPDAQKRIFEELECVLFLSNCTEILGVILRVSHDCPIVHRRFLASLLCFYLFLLSLPPYRSFIQGRVQISVELKVQKLGEEIAKEQVALDDLTKVLPIPRHHSSQPPDIYPRTCPIIPQTPICSTNFPLVSSKRNICSRRRPSCSG
jgi:hypothetical protein